jgi:hypothetical protein
MSVGGDVLVRPSGILWTKRMYDPFGRNYVPSAP